jgi:hypothetical protein
MEYDITRRTVFSTASEYKNLYSWFFQEYDASGSAVGLPQIPWAYSLYFDATKLTYRHSVKKVINWSEQTADETPAASVEENDSFYAQLRPNRSSRRSTVRYSFFGTDRVIEDISIQVETTDGEEQCSVWGCPRYTYEWDFEYVTQQDCLVFKISLTREKYDRLRHLVASEPKSQIVLRLNAVPGFYSEWSPSIRTAYVKVLANCEDQNVELPQGLAFEPPRLGDVKEFELTYTSTTDCVIKAEDRSNNLEDYINSEDIEVINDNRFSAEIPDSIRSHNIYSTISSSGGIVGILDIRSHRLYRLLAFPLFLIFFVTSLLIPIASVAYAFSLSYETWVRIVVAVGVMELAVIVLQVITAIFNYLFDKVFFFIIDPIPTEGRSAEQALAVAKQGDACRLLLKMNRPRAWTTFDTEQLLRTNSIVSRILYSKSIRNNITNAILSLRTAEADGVDLANDSYEVQRRINSVLLAQSWHQKLFMSQNLTIAMLRYVIFIVTLTYYLAG